MKFSLLGPADGVSYPADVVYELSVDKITAAFCGDGREAAYFLNVLTALPSSEADTVRRQEIFTDFYTIDGLFDDLRLVFTRYDRIKSDWHELKLGAAPRQSSSIEPQTLLNHSFAALKVTAVFPATIVAFYNSLSETLKKYPVQSTVLKEMRDYCSEMLTNDALSEIVTCADRFKYYTPEKFDFRAALILDETLAAVGCELTAADEHSVGKPGVFQRIFARRDAPPAGIALPDDDTTYDDEVWSINTALRQLDDALTSVTDRIYEVFFGLSREMIFYECALNYTAALDDARIPHCTPVIRPERDDIFRACRLRDPVLAAGGLDGSSIVANDAGFGGDEDGILLRGINDSGKTVFLRSVGIAQLFAQSGLPVCAESAEISLRRGIYAHFSSAEEVFTSDAAAGRFDGEARAVRQILDAAGPYSLVLFNETFQTTSYDEGTEGIYNVLRVFSALKVRFVFVTHLTGLFSLLDNGHTVLCRTSDEIKYTVCREANKLSLKEG